MHAIPVCGKLSCLTLLGDLVTYEAIMLSLCFSCAFCLRQNLRRIKELTLKKQKGGALLFHVPVYYCYPQRRRQSCS